MGTDSVRYLMMPKMANSPSAKPIFSLTLPSKKIKKNTLMLMSVKVK